METLAIVRDVAAGREREVALLVDEHAEACRTQVTRFAVVSGPAGIGKSQVLAGVRRELSARGTRVLEGHARRGAPRAFGPFSTLAVDLLQLAEESGTPARTMSDLSRRLGPLLGPPAPGGKPEDGRLLLADALAELFVIAGRARAAVLLHDVDAADAASIELVRYVAAALLVPGARAGGLVVLSHRDPAPPALADVLARLPGTRLPLAGLDLEGVRSYLSRTDIAERLLDITSGDPGRIEELIVAPPSDLARRRLERLDAPARHVLLAAAVLDAPRPAAILARMGGGEAEGLLAQLVAERFLTLTVVSGQPAYGLARESDRAALLAAAGAENLRALHASAADALAASGATPEEVARHQLQADPRGKGVQHALKAARALMERCAPAAALEFFRLALDAGAGGTELHRGVAEALRALGDHLGALRHVGLARRGATPRELRELRAAAASLCILVGKLPQAEKLCRQAVCGATDLEGADGPSVRAYADLCEIGHLRGDFRGTVDSCRAGLTATDLPPEIRLQLRNTMGKSHLALGAYDEARAAFEQNESEATQLGLTREVILARINVGVVAHRQGDRKTAMARYRSALEITPADPSLSALACGNLGALHHEAGDFHLAAEQYGSALAACTRARRLKGVSHWAANSARLRTFLGEGDQALRLAEHACEVAEELGDPYLLAQAQLVRGEALEVLGDLAGAARELALARDGYRQLGNPRYEAESGIALARVYLARGDVGTAAESLAAVEATAIARESAAVSAETELTGGEVLLARGELAAAGKRATRAKEILLAGPAGVGGDTDLEAPWRVYRLLAAVRSAQGDASGAAADLLRAVRLLEELASRVPTGQRQRFLAVRHRAELLAAAAEREITPERASSSRRLDEADTGELPLLVGSAPALQRLTRLITPVGRSMTTVLVRGESGTGKELVADAIHRASPRRDMPLVKVNCAAMHEELLLSELFGHEKGAFTGAVRERKGRFELADGGTIFLDEIGDVSPKAQVALLRVLQEKEFERVGGTRTLRVDVRVICATNRNLEQMIAEGAFRQDLYYRLKGVMLELPSLRERREDIPVLAIHFLRKVARERGEPIKHFSAEALELLARYPWPGNVRELENVVGAVSIFAQGEVVGLDAFELHGEFLEAARSTGAVDTSELAGSTAPPGEVDFYALARDRGVGLKELRHQLELQMIGRALLEAKGNISEAARLLQMKRSRLSQIVNAEPSMRALAKGVGV